MRKIFLALAGLCAAAPHLAHAQSGLPHVNACTGPRNGNYEFAWIQIAKQTAGRLNGTLVPSGGSMDNLDKLMKNECSVAIVQADALKLYLDQNPTAALSIERSRVMYPEYVHMICNTKSGVSEITDLKNQTVLIGPAGSGSEITWQNFKRADKRFENVQTQPIGGSRAAGQVQDGTDAGCMLSVNGLKAPSILEINNLAKTSGDRLRLVTVRDSNILDVKDSKGQPLYRTATIPGGTYSSLQHGFFSTAVPTVTVESILVANSKWVDANGRTYDTLLSAVNAAMPAINNRVNPR